MKIIFGADHAGYAVKERLRNVARAWGHEAIDAGPAGGESVDYPDYAEKVARAVSSGQADRGVLICGTGIGMSIAANKIVGVRAALVTDRGTAEMSRMHNDANVFCAGARVLPPEEIERNLQVWLSTAFEGARHSKRLEKIARLEEGRK